jgi:hypothetical protein
MNIVVKNHIAFTPPDDIHNQYPFVVWEVEVQSDILDSPEFESELRNNNNFTVSTSHDNNLRSVFTGTGSIADWLAQPQQRLVLDIASQSDCFKPMYYKSVDEYAETTVWSASVLQDQPGFKMVPHLDNKHVMVQMVVNLLQDYETATEFYYFNNATPCYRGPLKKNHGVIFLNTPGSVHGIANVNEPRWTLSAGVLV